MKKTRPDTAPVGNSSRLSTQVRVKDVAKHAGVSVATVSRSFNSPEAVREDVRDRVLATARALGYSPNPAAKALRMQRTHIVGAVVPTLDYAIYARMLNSFQESMSAAGYMVFVLAAGFDNSNLYGPVRQLVDRGAEGLLIVGKVEDPRLLKFLCDRHLPTVLTYSFLPDSPFPSIGFDNYAAMRQLTEYLILLRHRHMVLISGRTQGNDRQQSRVRDFRESAEDAGIAGSCHCVERPYSLTEGAAAMRLIHTEYPQTTAVICASDVLGSGLLYECKKLGIRVPADLTIAGFDNQDFSAQLDPPLTTVDVPATEMGSKSAEALVGAMMGQQAVESLRLETNLIVRGSTGSARS